MERERVQARLLILVAAAPGLAATLVTAAIALLGPVGGGLSFWQGGSLTLSEAAALHDHGELVRLIENGNDPNATYPLRPDVLADRSLTPIEAAVRSRRAEVVDLLMMHGATIDPDLWRRLHCFALEASAEDVAQTLDHYRPANVNQSCPEP